ncbi:MAG: hypothetical protein K2Q06_09160, partial [Parvularculaceae bacterium]|nr:hypothetical protein [Parvularculaceae bacterium]
TSTEDLAALKVHAAAVYRMIAEDAVQLHGGVGLTEEFYCHHYLKRALLNEALGADRDAVEAETGRALLASLKTDARVPAPRLKGKTP